MASLGRRRDVYTAAVKRRIRKLAARKQGVTAAEKS
jgi:hypothetical protein